MQRKWKYTVGMLWTLWLQLPLLAQSYEVRYTQVDSVAALPALSTSFNNSMEAADYLQKLPQALRLQGYLAASMDSLSINSAYATAAIFLGHKYQWATIRTAPEEAALLQAIRWPTAQLQKEAIRFDQLLTWQQRILDHLETIGYPFAQVGLDSVFINGPAVSALLHINRGPMYTFDSLHIEGAAIRPALLEQQLRIAKGSPYNRQLIEDIPVRLRELAYVQEAQPATVLLQGTGAVVNLFLKPRKSSQISALVGLLPNSNAATDKKLLITGEANILLRNSLGSGETIGLNWQQLQQRSPRLNVMYQQPRFLKLPVGLAFGFDMFRKDSSWLNLNLNLGASYVLSNTRSVTFFWQRVQTNLSIVDTLAVRRFKQLPTIADITSNNLGMAYAFANLDYRLNPRQGIEWSITTTAGIKKLRPNNQITELKDASFDYTKLYDTVQQQTYQARLVASAAKYSPIGKQSTLKTGVNAGLFQSGSYYFNELFQVGGYKLLRGFTEESQYLSHYLLGTLEYRYLIGPDSYFFGFADGGWGHNAASKTSYTYISTGLGLALETSAGIFNLAWAVGKRNDGPLNLRQSKVHLGFVNYF